MNEWNSIEFLDDDENIKSAMGIDVIGKTSDVSKYIKSHDIFIAIGNNTTRERFKKNLRLKEQAYLC